MLICALAMVALALSAYGRDPDRLSKLAHFTAPVAIVATAVFALLPPAVGIVLYVASPLFMAPAMMRRVYGVLYTAEQGNRITRYMGGISTCVAIFTVWMMIMTSTKALSLLPALLALPAWIGIRRAAPPPGKGLPEKLPGMSKINVLLVAATFAALLWLDTMNATLHTNIINAGIDESNPLYMILGFILPCVAFVMYGAIHDRGHERIGFICGMGLCIIGVVLALMPSSAQSGVLITLAFTDGLGGTYTEFFILTIPVFLFIGTKRPVLVASLGVIANLLSSAWRWIAEAWLPVPFTALGIPLYVSTAVTAVVFVVLVYIIFERYRENTLVAALYALIHSVAGGRAQPSAEAGIAEAGADIAGTGSAGAAEMGATQAPTPLPPSDAGLDTAETRSMMAAGLTQEEANVAQQLVDGHTRSDILRRLHISTAELGRREHAIRQKLLLRGRADPTITAIAAEYKLTKRETEMLDYLRDGIPSERIAAELYISNATVRYHVSNLMKKLKIDKRSDLAAWFAKFGS
jgi:DNA-binding CsgD family transcriptional regulator